MHDNKNSFAVIFFIAKNMQVLKERAAVLFGCHWQIKTLQLVNTVRVLHKKKCCLLLFGIRNWRFTSFLRRAIKAINLPSFCPGRNYAQISKRHIWQNANLFK
jgi:hypothetical protein